jgi:hypothetical protein
MAENGRDRTGSNARTEQLVILLATGHTIAAAAAQLGLSERTTYRSAAKPHVKERIRSLRSDMVSCACGRLCRHMTTAVDRLADLLHDPNSSVVLGAAKTLLTMALATAEMEQVYSRLAVIEDHINNGKTNGQVKGKGRI